MIFLTFMAFGPAASDVPAQFTIPIVLGFAFIQVILQFFYFMHMKDNGHDFAKLFIMTGIYFCNSIRCLLHLYRLDRSTNRIVIEDQHITCWSFVIILSCKHPGYIV